MTHPETEKQANQLRKNIPPETEFTCVIPRSLDSLVNMRLHEKLSAGAGNRKPDLQSVRLSNNEADPLIGVQEGSG